MPKKLESCVKKVSKQKGIKSAYGICSASTGIKRAKGGGWKQTKKTTKKTKKRRTW